MNKRILLSSISLFSSLALVTGATFAFFSDVGTSTDNVFAAGNLVMALSDDNETNEVDVDHTWGLNSAPGDTFSGDLKIKNLGSVDANHVELKFANAITESSTPPGSTDSTKMDTVIEITALTWDTDGDGIANRDLIAELVVTDVNLNGIIDLDDLENQAADDVDNLDFDGIDGNDHTLHMAGRLHPTFTVDQHQGDSVNMTLTVTMNQDASQ